MSEFTIAVIGSGVIGSSIGLALKQQSDPPRLLTHDKDLAISRAAVKKGAFDKAEWNLINACEKADLIILAMPLNGIRHTLEAVAPYLKEDAVITDTTRHAAAMLKLAEEILPSHVHFISGNPLVSPSGYGLDHARADLFKERLYCLTPSAKVSEAAVQLLVGVINLLGAEPYFVDAAEQDGLVITTEPLPTLLSVALLNTVSQGNSWRETRKFAGPIFEQATAGAQGDPDALKEELLAGGETLIQWLDRYMGELQSLRSLLTTSGEAEREEELAQQLDKAVVERLNWLKDYQSGRFVDPEIISAKIDEPGFMKKWLGLGR